MSVLKKLEEEMREVESGQRIGAFYHMAHVLTVMICGLLCNLQNISDIHRWATAESNRNFFEKYFRIKEIPCRAQFYNILGSVNPEKFNIAFIRWSKR